MNLVSLNILQLASRSLLILYCDIYIFLFFSDLRDHIENKKEAMTQVIGISSEVSTWKFRVNAFCAVMLGSYWERQLIRRAVTPVLAGQVTSEWYNVSITGGSCARLEQLGEGHSGTT